MHNVYQTPFCTCLHVGLGPRAVGHETVLWWCIQKLQAHIYTHSWFFLDMQCVLNDLAAAIIRFGQIKRREIGAGLSVKTSCTL